MAEERGAELGAAPKRRREPVCRQRRSVRSAARRGRWQPSWGAATAPRRGGAAAEGGGARGSGVCRRGGGGGEAAHAGTEGEVGGGGGQQAWRARRARLHGGGGRQQAARRVRSPARMLRRRPARPAPRAAVPHAARPRSGESARSRRSQEKLHGSTRKKSNFKNEGNSRALHLFH
ncbi:translation initiation factor IF-2-like isoform X5 [Aquila chrysaetos chrysaetos]|uniref:translation initiation factor IF-2-like isoform X5 n=1 Tax=Aquila chrysaetos chrysaetos TaxID=223781 RepID=UPI001176AFCE|nr:translation initiation factor IF-2-like isoform X5 [Aquila chrysaetos chrysaetos]